MHFPLFPVRREPNWQQKRRGPFIVGINFYFFRGINSINFWIDIFWFGMGMKGQNERVENL
jgi:hypothetical protein